MKKIFCLVILFLSVMILPFVVNAKTVSVNSFAEVKENNVKGDHLNFEGSTLKLEEDINLKAFLDIRADTTIDLNGHSLALSEHGAAYGIVVYGDNTLTFEGEGNVTINDYYGITTAIVGSPKIVVNGGTFTQSSIGYYVFGLTNGEMEVNDGTFTGPYSIINNFAGYYREDPDGIYNGGYDVSATLTINGGTFTATDEYSQTIINSDMTIINDGTFISEGEEGNTIYTTLTGTTIINKGEYTASGTDAVNVWNEGTTTIKDGKFVSENGTSIYDDVDTNAEAKTTATGGTYVDSTQDIEENVAEGYIQYKLDDDTIAIGKSSMKLLVVAIDDVSTGVQEEIDAIEAEVADGQTIGKYYEIDYAEVDPIDHVIRTISETSEEVTITLDVSSFPAVENGKVRTYYVYRYHDGEVELITDVTDNGDGTITFKSSKFSTYGVAYEDSNSVQPREDDNTNSNTSNNSITNNPNTSDNIMNYVIMLILSTLSLVFIIKKQYS